MNDTQPEPRKLSIAEKQDLDSMFSYHKPFGDQPERYEAIRAAGKLLAEEIILKTPPSPERSIALRKVRESVQWANASIAINEKPAPESAGGELGAAAKPEGGPAPEPAPAQP